MDIAEALDTALKAIAEDLTEVMQDSAQSSGWTEALAKSVNIGYAGNILELNVPSESEDAVFKKEYGTEDTPPTAVLRNLARHPKSRAIFDKHFTTHVASALDQMAGELL